MTYKPWNLTDLVHIEKNMLSVFTTFSCGGGSSMGYKLAGMNVVGCVEIDKKIIELYLNNHHPKFPYLMGIANFNDMKNEDLPEELFDLDILDGSPPCSVFSMAGQRENKWQVNAKFKEGQEKQILDDLFFDFLNTVEKLKPKVVVAENVKGLIMGNAKGYVNLILKRFKEIGYDVQLFCFNSMFMGVPQMRERVFFIARRVDLKLKNIELKFNEESITFGEIRSEHGDFSTPTPKVKFLLSKRIYTDESINDINQRIYKKLSGFTSPIIHDHKVPRTLTSGGSAYRYADGELLSKEDIINIQSFPLDYDFGDADPKYVCGMSVPPYMMERIASQIYKQWFK